LAQQQLGLSLNSIFAIYAAKLLIVLIH
jgi:hypothetical protein